MIDCSLNEASVRQLLEHMTHCDKDHTPPLSERVDLGAYAEKIRDNANTFEAWSDDKLVGVVAAYFNQNGSVYVTDVSINSIFSGKGIAARLLDECIDFARSNGMSSLFLEVNESNSVARRLYDKKGFEIDFIKSPNIQMKLSIKGVVNDYSQL